MLNFLSPQGLCTHVPSTWSSLLLAGWFPYFISSLLKCDFIRKAFPAYSIQKMTTSFRSAFLPFLIYHFFIPWPIFIYCLHSCVGLFPEYKLPEVKDFALFAAQSPQYLEQCSRHPVNGFTRQLLCNLVKWNYTLGEIICYNSSKWVIKENIIW